MAWQDPRAAHGRVRPQRRTLRVLERGGEDMRGSPRPWAVLLCSAALLGLVGCNAQVVGSGVRTGTAVAPDRETEVPLEGGGSVTVPRGGVDSPGTLEVVPVAEVGDVPPGLTRSGRAFEVRLRGTGFDAGATLDLPVPPLSASPDIAMLARYEPDLAEWQQIPAALNAGGTRLTATLTVDGRYTAFRIDTGWISATATSVLNGVADPALGAPAPACTGDPVAARITGTPAGPSVLTSCLGVADGAPELAITVDRGQVLAIGTPERWTRERTGPDDPVLDVLLEAVAAVPQRPRDAQDGRSVTLVGPRQQLRMGMPANRKMTLRVEPDPYALVATGLDYAADLMGDLAAVTPWISAPDDPAATSELVRTALSGEACRNRMGQLTREPARTPEQVGKVFRRATELGTECFAPGWAAALGRPDVEDPLNVLLTWLSKNSPLLFLGVVVGPALDFAPFRLEVEQTGG